MAASPSCHPSWWRMHSSPHALSRHIRLRRTYYNWPAHLPSKVTLASGSVSPCNTWFLGPTSVSPPNGISIGSAVFAQFTCVSDTQTRTHRRTDHATCDICSNRPHLSSACRRCSLKIDQHLAKLQAKVQRQLSTHSGQQPGFFGSPYRR